MTDCAVRETFEETGIEVEVVGLVGIDTGPRHVILYTSNNEARREFSIVYTASPLGGEPTPSDESREVVWDRTFGGRGADDGTIATGSRVRPSANEDWKVGDSLRSRVNEGDGGGKVCTNLVGVDVRLDVRVLDRVASGTNSVDRSQQGAH